MMLPVLLRIFIGVFIDAHLVRRKILGVFMNAVTCFFQFCIAFRILDSPLSVTWALLINNFSHQFIEGVCSTYIIQQARGVYRGQEDLQSFKFLLMGATGTLGALLGTILIKYQALRMIFAFRGLIYGLAVIQAMFLSPELESNERATIKTPEMIRFENEYRERMIARGRTADQLDQNLKLPFCSLLCMKLKMAKDGFMDPVFRNLTLFFIFISLTMPMFDTFDFYFHVDLQKIPLEFF